MWIQLLMRSMFIVIMCHCLQLDLSVSGLTQSGPEPWELPLSDVSSNWTTLKLHRSKYQMSQSHTEVDKSSNLIKSLLSVFSLD